MMALLALFASLGHLYRGLLRQAETRALLLLLPVIIGIGMIFYMIVEHWSLVNALYFCVVTLGTIGYGDVTPKTALGKLFTTLYIIVGLTVLGGFFAIAGRMVRRQLVIEEADLLGRERSQGVPESPQGGEGVDRRTGTDMPDAGNRGDAEDG
jgi:hypothetical protein